MISFIALLFICFRHPHFFSLKKIHNKVFNRKTTRIRKHVRMHGQSMTTKPCFCSINMKIKEQISMHLLTRTTLINYTWMMRKVSIYYEGLFERERESEREILQRYKKKDITLEERRLIRIWLF